MNALHNQHVLVLGLGLSGLAMARWCARQGALVTVADTRETPPQLAALQQACPSAVFVPGPFEQALLERQSWALIARSPGLLPKQLGAVWPWAEQNQVPLLGELDLFARALQELSQREHLPYRPQVLAITGTNGKTTVTSLTTLLLQRCGVAVTVAGNIGPSLLDMLAQALDAETEANRLDAEQQAAEDTVAAASVPETLAVPPEAVPAPLHEAADGSDAVDAPPPDLFEEAEDAPAQNAEADLAMDAEPTGEDGDEADADDGLVMLVPPPVVPPQPPHLPKVWVLELSSFQLDGVAGGAWDAVPTAATVLNISEDHLDWHGGMPAYIQAKTAVMGTEALMLLNRDDPMVMVLRPPMVTVKIAGRNRSQPARVYATFGLDAPTRPGDWGIESVNGMDWLVRALALDETRKRGRAADTEEEIYFQRLMPVDALRIRGRHNAANALAALALATSTGAMLAPMLHGLREYRGEPHRVEPVVIVNGVEYFDDSKGTNVGATLAAVQGLGAERRLVVILGGDGKGQDFGPLTAALARHARAVVLIGRDAGLIRQAVADCGVPLLDAATMPEAVRVSAAQALPGDAVLMSPACASLDMFDNYTHRARVFVQAVAELANEAGVPMEVAP